MDAMASDSLSEEQKEKLDSSKNSWQTNEEYSFNSDSKSSSESSHSSAKIASPLMLLPKPSFIP